MDSLLVPTAIVALAEIGDKTQLLALILAARFRKPWPIIAGIVAATLANHAAAGAVGAWFGSFFSDAVLHWILAASFCATALWTLVPDKLDDDEASTTRKFGPFLTTLIAFFIAEIGDKTQIATVMLAAQYPELWLVIIGTTLGMLIANVPVVLAGNFAAEKLPLTLIRRLAATAFFVLAIVAVYKSHAKQWLDLIHVGGGLPPPTF
ncbi:TMEM165/GDT1 family protein [Pseudomonas sp. W4I3]|uniref:TMEM165/GDT1 family protein n=1 Tax=Pseudomonas sp. W4I3 TaxID=3042294 RepID=UPI00358F0A88